MDKGETESIIWAVGLPWSGKQMAEPESGAGGSAEKERDRSFLKPNLPTFQLC